MQQLSRDYLKAAPPEVVPFGTLAPLPERAVQFGEGNFLRAFVDDMVDRLNERGLFNGRIAVVQPIARGMADALNGQDGLYTVLLRGRGAEELRIVTSVSRALDPHRDFDSYIRLADNPELRVVFSNTTEAGIAFDDGDRLTDRPQRTFPGKLTALLYRRYQIFCGDPARGLLIIPCELIDRNAETLREMVLRYAELWELEPGFAGWLDGACRFVNTLVDRIVTGYPGDEADALARRLGYTDRLMVAAEPFHLFVLEGPPALAEELPFARAGLNVIWTDDAGPYRERKVRILNGAHTLSVPAAFLAGHDTVGQMMSDDALAGFLRGALTHEVIPTLAGSLPLEKLTSFAESVLERFSNPHIRHSLLDISLNSVSKFRVRVLPSLLGYASERGALPERLCFSFAALIAFYGGERAGGVFTGSRRGDAYEIRDVEEVLEFFDSLRRSGAGAADRVRETAGRVDFWGEDLNRLPGFAEYAAECLSDIETLGVGRALAKRF